MGIKAFDFLTNAIRPKITRVDIAKDFFNGEYSPNQAREDRNKGLFTCHHVKPKGECLGSDWEEDDEAKMTKGKTYGIGSRESSKYVRVYEKASSWAIKQAHGRALKLNSKQKTSLSLSKFCRIRANISAAHIPFANDSPKRQRAYTRLRKIRLFQPTAALNG
ncbi:phage replication initiation protein [Neisseria gonorrhoeae]|uniref:Phage replication initiation protein n=1 Tax=Neisseria gonorrhoeae TaxID=485 RepID=A0A378VUS4_NEIGO|nr:phage replication initiation protein [Neisseria gonorrhoeae]